jgi:N-acetylglutamate synthase
MQPGDPATDAARVTLLDRLAVNATRPGTVEVLGGWLVRADETLPFRRCNSVVPCRDASAAGDVDQRISTVEAFYRSRGLPPRFQLSGCPWPADLDDLLAERGYSIEAPVDVLVGTVDGLRAAAPTASPGRVRTADTLDEAWLAAWPGDDLVDSTRSRLRAYRRLLSGIAPESVVVTLDVDDTPGAVGLAVIERGWMGIFGMVTRSDLRRRGAARSILTALAEAGRVRGAATLYLQVEQDNVAAQSLYGSVGLTRSHCYHYRSLPGPSR